MKSIPPHFTVAVAKDAFSVRDEQCPLDIPVMVLDCFSPWNHLVHYIKAAPTTNHHMLSLILPVVGICARHEINNSC